MDSDKVVILSLEAIMAVVVFVCLASLAARHPYFAVTLGTPAFVMFAAIFVDIIKTE